MDFSIVRPTDLAATSMWDEQYEPLEMSPLGSRAEVREALRAAIPSIDLDYGGEEDAYVDLGIYLTLHGDPVQMIGVNNPDADVTNALVALAAERGWAAFEDGEGRRL
jgi:hypothetical protein